MLNSMSLLRTDAALLIVGHGSTVNPDSSAPTLAHAAEIRRRNIFADVQCAFWKEEPSLRDALVLFDVDPSTSLRTGLAREVYVVPNFISEGYFTQTVIPRELELNGRTTARGNGQLWKYCEPVGNHALMTELLLRRAREIAPQADPAETSLLIVAHGTDLNENSAVAAKREAARIRARSRYAAVLNVYMEETPRVSEWRQLTNTKNVVVVPFFISDGLHSYEDIPALLGIGRRHSERTPRTREESRNPVVKPIGDPTGSLDCARDDGEGRARGVFGPHKIDNRSLYYAPSIGSDPGIADIILEQVAVFDGEKLQTDAVA